MSPLYKDDLNKQWEDYDFGDDVDFNQTTSNLIFKSRDQLLEGVNFMGNLGKSVTSKVANVDVFGELKNVGNIDIIGGFKSMNKKILGLFDEADMED